MKTPLVDRINRLLLALIGTIALLAGVAVLLHSTGALGSRRAASPVIASPTVDWFNAHQWVWPVAGAVAALVAGLCIWWISAQLRTHGVERLELARASGGALTVSTSHLEDCLEQDAASYAEIERARARILVAEDAVHVELTIVVGPPYDVARAVSRVTSTVFAHLASTLDEPQPKGIRSTITIEAAEAALTRLR